MIIFDFGFLSKLKDFFNSFNLIYDKFILLIPSPFVDLISFAFLFLLGYIIYKIIRGV